MAIRDEFEHTRASLLHRSPLPSLESVLSELISKETRFSTMKLHNTFEMAMATVSCNMRALGSIPTGSCSSHRTYTLHLYIAPTLSDLVTSTVSVEQGFIEVIT
jgi:hypothetical protein